ncbi:MAG TPA: polysaccharide biosynthesis protein [Firmicutes bacterium]|nr:polysaccharide biosynthesis protein [Bacillota bacterium]
MPSNSVARGTAILIASGVLNRAVGFAVRIVLVRIMGPEGIGIFSRVSSIYLFVLSLASAGIPAAVTRLSAVELGRNRPERAARVATISLIVTAVTGGLATVTFIVAAPRISSGFLGDPRTCLTVLSIAPALFIVSVASVGRGFLTAHQRMGAIAVSQVAERIVSGIVNIVLVRGLISYGIEYAVAGLALGTVAGEVAGLVVILPAWRGLRHGHELLGAGKVRAPGGGGTSRGILKDLAGIAVPVAGARAIGAFSQGLTAVIIPRRLLAAGFDMRAATALYGNFQGISTAVVFFPTIFTFSLGSNLVPALSRARAARSWAYIRCRVMDSIAITILLGVFSTVFLFTTARILCGSLFKSPEATPILVALGTGAIMIYLRTISGSILHGLGLIAASTRNFVTGTAVSLAFTYWLTGVPCLNIYGAVIGVILGNAVNALLNLTAASRHLGRLPGAVHVSLLLSFRRMVQEFARTWRTKFYM